MLKITSNTELAKKHYDTIKNRLIKRINTVLKNGVREQLKETHKYKYKKTEKDCEQYLRNLISQPNENYPNLFSLIVAEPDKFENIIRTIKCNYSSFLDSGSDSNRMLYNIFVCSCYEKKEHFDKDNFISNIGLKTCPYCNRNYIYNIISKNGELKPQIDHFYPKSKYPFLAMSYFNLIPSCPTCNGVEAKGENDPLENKNKLKNPYLIDKNDFNFSYELTNASFKDFIEVKLECPTEGYNTLFKLDELYKKHDDHVEELIFKSEIKYPYSYRKAMEEMFNNSISSLDFSRFLLGNYVSEDELHKRPLAKLYRDIAKQLGLIE